MADYQKMYYILFNAMSQCTETMLNAMQQAEELYITADETPIAMAENPQPCKKAAP